jgi:hypothetical protein
MYVVARYTTYPSGSRSAAKELADGLWSLLLPSTGALPRISWSWSRGAIAPVMPSPVRLPDPMLPSFELSLPRGAILHCTAVGVSRLFYKVGQITTSDHHRHHWCMSFIDFYIFPVFMTSYFLCPCIRSCTISHYEVGVSPSKSAEIQSIGSIYKHGKHIRFWLWQWGCVRLRRRVVVRGCVGRHNERKNVGD